MFKSVWLQFLFQCWAPYEALSSGIDIWFHNDLHCHPWVPSVYFLKLYQSTLPGYVHTQRASRNFDVESTSKFGRRFFNAFSTFFRRQIKNRRNIDVVLEVSTSIRRRINVEKALKNVRILSKFRRRVDVDSTSKMPAGQALEVIVNFNFILYTYHTYIILSILFVDWITLLSNMSKILFLIHQSIIMWTFNTWFYRLLGHIGLLPVVAIYHACWTICVFSLSYAVWQLPTFDFAFYF